MLGNEGHKGRRGVGSSERQCLDDGDRGTAGKDQCWALMGSQGTSTGRGSLLQRALPFKAFAPRKSGMPWRTANLSSAATEPQQPSDRGKRCWLPGCAGIQKRAVLLKQPLAEAGISVAQPPGYLWSKVAQGGKHKDKHDVKIRQIWRETENSFPAFKLPQQDAQSTCNGE